MGVNTLPADPTMEGWQQGLWDLKAGRGPAEKWAKGFLKRWKRGDDVSQYGELGDIRQRAATAGSNLSMDYMTGANGLLASEGSSDDINQMNRMRDLGRERINQQMGEESVDALSDLSNNALGASERGRQFRLSFEAANKQAALGNRMNYYGARYQHKRPFWQEALLSGISGGSQVASAFAGGG